MCGLIGILGKAPVTSALLEALKRALNIAVMTQLAWLRSKNGQLHRCRAEGKLRNLEACLLAKPLGGCSGIGHTRWATHGAPNEQNAHPHATNRVAVVHNGIIDNYRELKAGFDARSILFETETDMEVAAHLVTFALEASITPVEAVQAALERLEGAYALAFLFEGEEDLLIAARRGSPLAIGSGRGETFLGSDAIPLAPSTDSIAYLEDGDLATLTHKGIEIRDESRTVHRAVQKSLPRTSLVEKGNYRHFMRKEIYEQPEMVSRTLAHYRDSGEKWVRLRSDVCFDFTSIERIALAACGTAYYADLVARYWFERPGAATSRTRQGADRCAQCILSRVAERAIQVVLEGALKLKEISYIHAEGYAAGELKHGPLALIDDRPPVVVVAPSDPLLEKTASNIQEVVARGGRVILLADTTGAAAIDYLAREVMILPSVAALVTSLLYAIPVQLIAYHTAVLMGRDVDRTKRSGGSLRRGTAHKLRNPGKID